jgi:uncharacterized protein YraI
MSLVRIAALAAIVTLSSMVGAMAKPVSLTAETNLRKSPGTDSEVLTLMPKGTTVEVGKCTNGWCQASADGKDGYAIAQNLGMAPRRAQRPHEVVEDEEEEYVYGPPPAYVVGPPVYYGYRPYGYYGGWGWGYRGGWGRRW